MRNSTARLSRSSRLSRLDHLRRSGLATLAALLALLAPLQAAQPGQGQSSQAPPAQGAQFAQGTEAAQSGAAIEISGRIAVGHDTAFIKDAEGYCLVQGHDLTPFAGRFIQAKGLVIGTDQEYRTVRLLEYRILSPDDDSPGAAGAARQTGGAGKKK